MNRLILLTFLFLPYFIQAQDIKGFYSTSNGFDANVNNYRLLLYDSTFYLTKSLYTSEGQLTETKLFGTYQDKNEYLLLTASNEETVAYDENWNSIKNKSIKLNKTIKASIKKDENQIFLSLNAFNRELTLNKFINPPDTLYKLIEGRYYMEKGNYYFIDLLISGPNAHQYNYGEYFYLEESTIGECGYGQYDNSQGIQGSYKIENGKLYLLVSLHKNHEGINKKQIQIHPIETIPVDVSVTKDQVSLTFTVWNKEITLSKPIK